MEDWAAAESLDSRRTLAPRSTVVLASVPAVRTALAALAVVALAVSGCSGDDGGSPPADGRPPQERLADALIAQDIEQTDGLYDHDCLRELSGVLDDEVAEIAVALLTADERPEVSEETQQVLDAFASRLFNCLPIDAGG